MTLRKIRSEWVCGLAAFLAAGVVPSLYAQSEPEPATPEVKPGQVTPGGHTPSTQEAEALQKLLELRDKMEKEQREREARGEVPEKGHQIKPGERVPPPTPEQRQRDAEMKRAQAAAAAAEDESYPPKDFVGPPATLAPDPSSGDSALTPEDIRARAEAARAGQTPTTGEGTPEAAGEEQSLVRKAPDPNEPTEWFSFSNTPWEDVIAMFVKRIGKPLMNTGDVVIGGELTYTSDRKFTKEEAIDELNLILHDQGYRFVEQEHHIRVVPLTEMPQWVPVKETFPTVEAFDESNPRDMDYVTVYYRVPDWPAQMLVDLFIEALPDYTRVSALEKSNQIKITALARDVRKFLTLKDKINYDPEDPRKMRIFEIKTNAREIEQMVRDFLNLGGGSGGAAIQMERDPRTGRPVPRPVAQQPEQTAQVQMVADDRTNSIIVKATVDQLAEIEKLIAQFDKPPQLGEFRTEVHQVQHSDATEIANLMNQIFQQEQGQQQARTPNWQRLRQLQQMQAQQAAMRGQRNRAGQQQPQVAIQAGGAAPEDIMTESIFERARKTIRLVADARMNVLIVYANDDGQTRVRELLKILDTKQNDTFQVVAVEHVKVDDIASLVTELAAAQAGDKPSSREATVVPDAANNVFYVLAEGDDLTRITDLIAQLDVEGAAQNRHIVELKNLKPSEVAQMVQTLLTTGSGRGDAGAAIRRQLPGRARGGRMTPAPSVSQAPTYQLIPLDEAGVLIVYCTDEDWERVDETIKLWDGRALSSTPELEAFTIEKGDAGAIAETLNTFYRQYQHPILGRTPVGIQADGEKVWVYAIRPAIEEIAPLIAALDVEPAENRVEILPLANADAATVATQLQAMFGMGRGGRPRTTSAPIIQAEPTTNALLVQASKADLEKIKDFAQRMDISVGDQQPERWFYTPKQVDAREAASAVAQLYGGGARRGGMAVGAQIKAFATGSQVIVEAPLDKLPEIQKFVTELDAPKGSEIVIKTIKLENGGDVQQVAQRLNNAFREKPNMHVRCDADPQSETILLTCTRDALPQVEAVIEEYAVAARGQAPRVEFRQMKFAQATDAATWLREQLITSLEPQLGRRAADAIRVTADQRTNRLAINGPEFAVTLALALLDQYDVEAAQAPVSNLEVVLRKMPGLDVQKLATSLSRTFDGEPRRPDGLRAVFTADEATQSLIISAPKDMFDRIEKLIAQYEPETKELELEQKFVAVKDADAAYVAQQVSEILKNQVGAQRGRQVVERISLGVDSRRNQIILNAPKFVMPLAERLIAEFDQPPTTETELRTIALENADADSVLNVLKQIFAEKLRAKTLTISAEPMTNTLIVGGSQEDFDPIEKWAKDLDTRAGVPRIVDLDFADAGEVANLVNQQFGQRGGAKASVSNGILIVTAPPARFKEIEALIDELDRQDPSTVQIKTYNLKVLNAATAVIAVQGFLRDLSKNSRPGQLKPGAFAEPTTNTLVVMAPAEVFPVIDQIISDIEDEMPDVAMPQAYPLINVRAEQIAPNVDAMLKAKVSEREGQKRTTVQTTVFADPTGNRLFVYASQDYQQLAAELIKLVDQEVQSTDIVHIITLDNGDATQVAASLNQIIQGNSRGSGTPGARSGTATVRVTADTGSNSIILAGMPKDVAEVEKWMKELDANSTRVPELQIFPLQFASATDIEKLIQQIFGTAGKNPQEAVSVSVDDYTNRLFVTANRRKMRQVEAYIRNLDAAPGDPNYLMGGKELYFVDINRGSASDIAWDVRNQVPDEEHGGPTIESDWFDEYLTVKCRPSEFPQIERLIRQFERRYKVEPKIVQMALKGIDLDALRSYLEARDEGHGNVQFELPAKKPTLDRLIVDVWAEGEAPNGAASDAPVKPARRIAPFQMSLSLTEALLADIEAELNGSRAPAAQPKVRVPQPAGMIRPAVFTPQVAADPPVAEPPQARPPIAPTTAPEARDDTAGRNVPSPVAKEPTRVYVDEKGNLTIKGERDDVDDIRHAIELFEEERSVGEVIRIFRFRYGDVNAAAEILNIMFDVRQRQQFMLPQQLQQQQQRRGQGQGQQGQDDERRPQGMLDQLQGMIGGQQQERGGGTSGQLRIATDPGHNYLIVKCDESYLPEIHQLLRELDIPPGKVELKVFQLSHLDANETAENIKDVLGISKLQSRRGLPGGQAGGRRGAGGQMQPQQQLLEMLQQQMVSVPGVEGGAKVERVEIVPNEITNSLLVSAPPEVMALVSGVITELEGLEERNVVGVFHHELKNARVDDVLPLLQEVFANATGGGGRGGAPGPRGGGGAPGALGAVTISGDPRNNTIIFTAEGKDVAVVTRQIELLDIPGAVNESEMYVCLFGDASAIASTLEPIYTESSGGRRRPGGAGGEAGAAVTDVRIVAEPATNTIVVFGPPEKRDLIFADIEKLDKLAKRDIREIKVAYADPEKLANTLMEILSGSGGGGAARPASAGRRGGAGAAQGALESGRIMILGDKSAKKLLVRAPDEVFEQIQGLVTTLDQPDNQLQLKRFQLQYAQAETVVESLKTALTEYMALASKTGTDTDFDAFTAVPDPRTNSVVVVGSEETFLFVSRVLAAIDVETPADQQRDFRIFALDRADAQTVADAINGFASGLVESGAGGRGRGANAAAAGGARTLNVQAVPELGTNSVLVFGRSDDIDQVEDAVIAPLEDKLADRFRIETVPVANVPPSQIVGFIYQFLDAGAAQAATGGQGRQRGGAAGTPQQTGPQIIPNDTGKNLIVRGTRRQVDEIRDLVAQFDNPDIVASNVKVIPVPAGEDVERLAGDLEEIVNRSEEDMAESTGRRARRITVVASAQHHGLILSGEPAVVGTAETVLKQLFEVHSPKQVTRILQVRNLSAQDAVKAINDFQQGGTGSGSRGSSQRSGVSPRPSRRGSSGGGGGSSPGRQTPTPSDSRIPSPHAPAWAQPFVGVNLVIPTVAAWSAADPPPAGSTPAKPPAKPAARPKRPSQPRAFTPGADPAASQDPPAPTTTQPRRRPRSEPVEEPPAPPAAPARTQKAALPPAATPATRATLPSEVVEMLSGVSGTLQGEVTAQALDSQQLVVTGDEADVDFIEQILALMEHSATPALVEVFPLEYAKAAALAPVIETAIKAQIDARTGSPGPQDRFSINAEGRSNSLIVSASEAVMNQIADLIDRLDIERAPGEGTDVRSIVLNHMRASEAVAVLKPTIEKLNKMREEPAESQASISAVERNNSVMIVGTRKDLEEIGRLVETLDVELDEDSPGAAGFVTADVIILQLKNGVAADVAKVLTDMIKEQQEAARNSTGEKPGEPFVKVLRLRLADGKELPPLNLERPIKVLPEAGTNSLIIFSTKENNKALAEIIDVFDQLPIGAETDVKAFALQYAGAAEVAKLVQDLFKDKSYLKRPGEGESGGLEKGKMPPVPPGVAARGLPYPVVVQHDVRSNVVIVVGRSDAVLLAGGLISQLDKPTLELGMKAYVLGPLKFLQAAQVTEKLQKLLTDRAAALGGDKNKARDSAVLAADERSNSLIVFATPDVYDMLGDLVHDLDVASKYSVVDMRFRPVKHTDAVKLEGLLTQMFEAKAKAEKDTNKDSKDSLTVVADSRSNGLLMTGTRDYLDEAEALATQLDQDFKSTVEFRAIKPQLNSAVNIAALLKDTVDKALKNKDTKLSGTEIVITADPVSDTLLVAAASEDLDTIVRWIDIMDRPSEVGRMTRIIPLKRGNAEDVAKQAQDLFKFDSQGGAQIDLSVMHDPATNSVVAFGPPSLVQSIESFVRQLDTVEAEKHAVVQIFKLDQADAETVGDLLTRVLDGEGGTIGGGGRSGSSGGTRQEAASQVMLIYQDQVGAETLRAMREDITVLADIRTNSLIVTAPAESMRLMESMIKAVDVPPDAAKVRVFRLVNADAEQMVTTLKELFERRETTATGGGGGGGQQESERVLTIEGSQGGRQEIAFTTDMRTNSVIAAGTPGYLDLVEQMIIELDTIPIKDVETIVYSPKNITAEELAPTIVDYSDKEKQRLQDVSEDISAAVLSQHTVTAIASKDANRLVLGVDPRQKANLMQVIDQLDQPPPQVLIQVLIVEVTMDNDLELGVEFAFQDLQYAKAGPADTTTFDYVGGTDVGAAGSGLGGFTFTVTGADFNFLFRTLQAEGSLKVLSRPQIVAMNNKEALIKISDDVPYVSGTQTSSTGQISTAVSRKDVGITLKVTPQINPDGFVSMEIDQEVSDLTDSTINVGPGVSSPVFFTRQAQTNIMVKDNETVVLGGLITSRVSNRENKVPILGDIPLLGWLMRYQNDASKRTELMLVLTPHVLRTPEDYRQVSEVERDNLKLLSPETLDNRLMQGLRVPLEEQVSPEAAGTIERATPTPIEPEPGAAPEPRDVYGPVQPVSQPEDAVDPNSYDVPISWVQRAAS